MAGRSRSANRPFNFGDLHFGSITGCCKQTSWSGCCLELSRSLIEWSVVACMYTILEVDLVHQHHHLSRGLHIITVQYRWDCEQRRICTRQTSWTVSPCYLFLSRTKLSWLYHLKSHRPELLTCSLSTCPQSGIQYFPKVHILHAFYSCW